MLGTETTIQLFPENMCYLQGRHVVQLQNTQMPIWKTNVLPNRSDNQEPNDQCFDNLIAEAAGGNQIERAGCQVVPTLKALLNWSRMYRVHSC